MYICEDCGNTFEHPKLIQETHGLECGPYEKWNVCPHCNSSAFVETCKCKSCGFYITHFYYETDDGIYCPECIYKGSIFDWH